MTCIRCGNLLRPGATFCDRCGEQQRPPAQGPTRPQPKPAGRALSIFAVVAVVATCAFLASLVVATRPSAFEIAAVRDQPRPSPVPTVPISYERVDIRALAKDPDAYLGAGIEIEGEAFSISERGGRAMIQLWVEVPDGSKFDREAVIVSFAGRTPGVYEGSHLYVLGLGAGAYTGTNAMGGAIRQPMIVADKVTILR